MAADRLRAWVVNHDDSWIFIVLYVGLAVVLSLWISLFWLLVVVAGHFVLEWMRQRHVRERGVLPQILWELKLDLALVLFALVLTLYMEVLFGVLGLQAAGRAGAIARAGARGGSRFAAWERTLRGLLLSADDAAQVARAVATRGAKKAAAREAVAAAPALRGPAPADRAGASRWGDWTGRWGRGDRFAVGLGVVCLVLIALAPWLTSHDYASALAAMAHELRPFPGATALSASQ